jgi:hypothetical protein
MAAIVGFVVGEKYTDPEIVEINVSETENLVYMRKAGQWAWRPAKSRRPEEQLEPAHRRGRADAG